MLIKTLETVLPQFPFPLIMIIANFFKTLPLQKCTLCSTIVLEYNPFYSLMIMKRPYFILPKVQCEHCINIIVDSAKF